MIANVLHISLNARGGAERLSVSAIRALAGLGIDVELGTYEKPDLILMSQAYGDSLEDVIRKTTTLNLLSGLNSGSPAGKYDLTLNTHADMLPFYREGLSRHNFVAYCHYPIAECLMDAQAENYLSLLGSLGTGSMTSVCRKKYFDMAKALYRKMMTNSMLLTNSQFSRLAILRLYGVDSTVLHPPVDVESFRRGSLSSRDDRQDSLLVVSRFHRSKKIENAIMLAKLLKREEVCVGMNIIGNISPDGFEYYEYLAKLVRRYHLEGFVNFEINVKSSRLMDLMRRSKAYFHSLPGEPFGISTVEAMSAGLIPVVPDLGGQSEFVPLRYQFHTFGEAVEAVTRALDSAASERLLMSQLAQSYSTERFVEGFRQIVGEMLEIGRSKVETAPVPSFLDIHRDAAAA